MNRATIITAHHFDEGKISGMHASSYTKACYIGCPESGMKLFLDVCFLITEMAIKETKETTAASTSTATSL